ncbi:MAG: WbqC family protein [Acidobacteriia bacterium]|nr:WbqC family protein [Terriglobia bacterium]
MNRVILTAHQPVYLPWLGLFHKIASADTFVSFDEVQYLPRDWNNRNKIKTASGAIWLTVPVLTKGHREKPIREIEINNREPWRRKHWNAISLNYRKAPFFAQYEEFLRSVYQREWQWLWELNEHMLRWFLEVLGINVRFLRASELGLVGAKSDVVLDMCRKLGAKTYIFGALGRDYARVEDFQRAGIEVVFQEYRHPEYSQLHGAFISHLSLLDLLFNCGPKSLEILMKDQERIPA